MEQFKDEIWKDIKEYEGHYQISNYGKIKSIDRMITMSNGVKIKIHEKILKNQTGSHNYYYAVLCKKSIQIKYLIHRLIALHFISNPENKPEINHKDGNKKNNNINNLEWCTHSENLLHAIRTGLISNKGEKHGRAKLTEKDVINIRKEYKNKTANTVQLSNKYNISRSTISCIINYRSWTHI